MTRSTHHSTRLAAATILIVAFAAATPDASAQSLRPGLKIGLATSTFSGESNADWGMRTGFMGGGTLAYDWENGFALQSEVLYVIKGGQSDSATVANAETAFEVDVKVAYLEIPLLLSYRIDGGGSLHPRFFAGPFLGLNMDATVSWHSGDQSFQESDDSVTSSEFGVAFGAALDVSLGGEFVSFGVQGAVGLSDITKLRVDGTNPSLSTTSVQFFVALAFQ